MTQTQHTGWNTFTDLHNMKLTVAIIGRHRYTIQAGGYLTVTMKYSNEEVYAGKFRALANAKSYAEELASAGGPRR